MFFQLLSSFVKFAGSMVQSSAQQTSARYNQMIDNYNANVTQQEGEIAANAVKQQGLQQVGEDVAAAGEGGFSSTSGSAVDIIRQSAYNAEMNVLNTRYSYAAKAKGFANQGVLQGARASYSKVGGYFSAAGVLAGGLGQADKLQYLKSNGGYGSYSINSGN